MGRQLWLEEGIFCTSLKEKSLQAANGRHNCPVGGETYGCFFSSSYLRASLFEGGEKFMDSSTSTDKHALTTPLVCLVASYISDLQDVFSPLSRWLAGNDT